jgi:hypothetical protein
MKRKAVSKDKRYGLCIFESEFERDSGESGSKDKDKDKSRKIF